MDTFENHDSPRSPMREMRVEPEYKACSPYDEVSEPDYEYGKADPNDSEDIDYEYGPDDDGPASEYSNDGSTSTTSANATPEQILARERRPTSIDSHCHHSIHDICRVQSVDALAVSDPVQSRRKTRRVSFAAGDDFCVDDDNISVSRHRIIETFIDTPRYESNDIDHEYGSSAPEADDYQEPDYGYGDGAPDKIDVLAYDDDSETTEETRSFASSTS